MNITIELKESIIQSTTHSIKQTITFLYKWLTTEGEALGYILGHIHFTLFLLLLLCIIIAHTIYPEFWFQTCIFLVLLAIWLQHVILKVCVSTVAENDLTNKQASPFHELVEMMFHISTDDFINYFIVAETVALCCFALELIAQISFLFL
jgi:predicted nucleic acid-binding OB-fold protein